MKRKTRQILIMMLSALLTVSLLAGCSSKPKADDAKAYVQAVLDIMCTGDYDHSVKLADIEEGKETEMRDEMIDTVVSQLTASANLDEEVTQGFTDLMIDALAKAKYSVVDAQATDDGGFDVTVSIEPLKIFAGLGDDYEAKLTEKAEADADKIMAMSTDERNNYAMKILLDMMKEGLSDPQYGEAEEVTVHYGQLEENAYGCSEADGQALGSKLFSTEGME